jgi:phage tail-like protein
MADIKDPLLGFSFYVSVSGIIEAGFVSCTGLSVKRETTTHQEGGMNDYVHTLPGRTSYGNITLKRGVAFSNQLWDWFAAMFDFGRSDYANKAYRNVLIHQYIPYTATRVRDYELEHAFPISWAGPDLNMNSNEVAIESLEIAFRKFTVTHEGGATQ